MGMYWRYGGLSASVTESASSLALAVRTRSVPNRFFAGYFVCVATQVGRANAFKTRIQRYLDSTPVGLAFIARSSTKKEDEEEEVHKHCIGDVKG